MKILITGSAGFIGRHLGAELTKSHNLIGVDVAHSSGENLLLPGFAERIVREVNPDIVVHLAAMVGRVHCESWPGGAVHFNVEVTANVAKSCANHGVKLVYASSSEIYGDNGVSVCDEYLGPFSPPGGIYGLTKLQGEQVVQLYCPDSSLILRLCMPYGPDSPTGPGCAALPTFIANAIAGRPSKAHSGTSRSWCYIDDTVRAMRMAIEHFCMHEKDSLTMNIGHDKDYFETSVLADFVYRIAGADPALVRVVPPPEGIPAQVRHKRLSFERLYSLGFEPETYVQKGIERCLAQMRVAT